MRKDVCILLNSVSRDVFILLNSVSKDVIFLLTSVSSYIFFLLIPVSRDVLTCCPDSHPQAVLGQAAFFSHLTPLLILALLSLVCKCSFYILQGCVFSTIPTASFQVTPSQST